MKVHVLDPKTTLIRHWGRWYIVGRSGSKWVKVKLPVKSKPQPTAAVDSIEAAAASLREAHPETITRPPIDLK